MTRLSREAGLLALQLCVTSGPGAGNGISHVTSLSSVLYAGMTADARTTPAIGFILSETIEDVVEEGGGLDENSMNMWWGLRALNRAIAESRYPTLAWVRAIQPEVLEVLDPVWHPQQRVHQTPRSLAVARSHAAWPKKDSQLDYFVDCAAAATSVDCCVLLQGEMPMVPQRSWMRVLTHSVDDVTGLKLLMMSCTDSDVEGKQQHEHKQTVVGPQRKNITATTAQKRACKKAKGTKSWFNGNNNNKNGDAVDVHSSSEGEEGTTASECSDDEKEQNHQFTPNLVVDVQLHSDDKNNQAVLMSRQESVKSYVTNTNVASSNNRNVTNTTPTPQPYWHWYADMCRRASKWQTKLYDSDKTQLYRSALRSTGRTFAATDAMLKLEDQCLPEYALAARQKRNIKVTQTKDKRDVPIIVRGTSIVLCSISRQFLKTKPSLSELRKELKLPTSFKFSFLFSQEQTSAPPVSPITKSSEDNENDAKESEAVDIEQEESSSLKRDCTPAESESVARVTVTKLRRRWGTSRRPVPVCAIFIEKTTDSLPESTILNELELRTYHCSQCSDVAEMFEDARRFCTDALSFTPLHVAAMMTSTTAVRHFLTRHHHNEASWLNARNSRGETPLHLAVIEWMKARVHGNQNLVTAKCAQDVIEILLDAGANIYAKDKRSNTPHSIAMSFLPTLSKCVTESACDVSTAHSLLSHQNTVALRITNFGVLVDGLSTKVTFHPKCGGHPIKNTLGLNVAHTAAMYGHVEMLRVIMDYSGRYHALSYDVPTLHGDTILHMSVQSRAGFENAFPFLLEHLSNTAIDKLILTQNRSGRTPLHLALAMNRSSTALTALLDALVERGTFSDLVSLRDCHNDTVMDLLLAHSTYANQYTHLVAQFGSVQNVETVMKASASAVTTYLAQLNWSSERYISALHTGLNSGNIAMFMAVLSHCVTSSAFKASSSDGASSEQLIDLISPLITESLWRHNIPHDDILQILVRVTCEHALLRWKIHQSMAEDALHNGALRVVGWLLSDMPSAYSGERGLKLFFRLLFSAPWLLASTSEEGVGSAAFALQLLDQQRSKDAFSNVALTLDNGNDQTKKNKKKFRPVSRSDAEKEDMLVVLHRLVDNFIVPVSSPLFEYIVEGGFPTVVFKVVSSMPNYECVHEGHAVGESLIARCMEVNEAAFFRLTRSIPTQEPSLHLVRRAARCSARILSQVLDWAPTSKQHVTSVLQCAITHGHVHLAHEILANASDNEEILDFSEATRGAVFAQDIKICRDIMSHPAMVPCMPLALYLSLRYARQGAFRIVMEKFQQASSVPVTLNGRALAIEAALGRSGFLLRTLLDKSIITSENIRETTDENDMNAFDACFAFGWSTGITMLASLCPDERPSKCVSDVTLESGAATWDATFKYLISRNLHELLGECLKRADVSLIGDEHFFLAIIKNSLDAMRFLLQNKPTEYDLKNAMIHALKYGTLEMVVVLFDVMPMNDLQDARDASGRTILHLAALRSEETLFFRCVTHFGTLKATPDSDGLKPIHNTAAVRPQNISAYNMHVDPVKSYADADPLIQISLRKQRINAYELVAAVYICHTYDEPESRADLEHEESRARDLLDLLRTNHIRAYDRRKIKDYLFSLNETALSEHNYIVYLCQADTQQRAEETNALKVVYEYSTNLRSSASDVAAAPLDVTSIADETEAKENDDAFFSPRGHRGFGRQHKFDNIRRLQANTAEGSDLQGPGSGLKRLFNIADASATRSLWTGLFHLRRCVEGNRAPQKLERETVVSSVTRKKLEIRMAQEQERRKLIPEGPNLNSLRLLLDNSKQTQLGLMYLRRAANMHTVPPLPPPKVSSYDIVDGHLDDVIPSHTEFLRRSKKPDMSMPTAETKGPWRGLKLLFAAAPLTFNVPPKRPPEPDMKWHGLLCMRLSIHEKPKKHSGVVSLLTAYDDARTRGLISAKKKCEGLELLRGLLPPHMVIKLRKQPVKTVVPAANLKNTTTNKMMMSTTLPAITTTQRSQNNRKSSSAHDNTTTALATTVLPPLAPDNTLQLAKTLLHGTAPTDGVVGASSLLLPGRHLPGSNHLRQLLNSQQQQQQQQKPELMGPTSMKKLLHATLPIMGLVPKHQLMQDRSKHAYLQRRSASTNNNNIIGTKGSNKLGGELPTKCTKKTKS